MRDDMCAAAKQQLRARFQEAKTSEDIEDVCNWGYYEGLSYDAVGDELRRMLIRRKLKKCVAWGSVVLLAAVVAVIYYVVVEW